MADVTALTIVTPTSSFTRNISWLEINSSAGNRIIKPSHAPLITLLKPRSNVLFLTEENVLEELPISSGVCRVEREGITLVITPL